MEREGRRPGGEQFAEGRGSDQPGSAVSPFDTFVERLALTGETPPSEERGLQLIHPATPFFLMDDFNFHYEYHHWNDIGFQPTEEQDQFIKHVKLAYGIIAYPYCETETSSREPSPVYQKEIEHRVAIERVYEGRNRVLLTDAEREILVKIANAAGVPCDPARNEYFFDEIPCMTLEGEGFIQPQVVDADQ